MTAVVPYPALLIIHRAPGDSSTIQNVAHCYPCFCTNSLTFESISYGCGMAALTMSVDCSHLKHLQPIILSQMSKADHSTLNSTPLAL